MTSVMAAGSITIHVYMNCTLISVNSRVVCWPTTEACLVYFDIVDAPLNDTDCLTTKISK